jgi:hypothetical protein
VIPGFREIPDPQAEAERLAEARKPAVVHPAARALLARRYKFTPQQIDGLTRENIELLLAAGDGKESE